MGGGAQSSVMQMSKLVTCRERTFLEEAGKALRQNKFAKFKGQNSVASRTRRGRK